MPTTGVSSEWIADLEDDIARILTARDQVEQWRQLGELLRRRDLITPAYYSDLRDSLDSVTAALLIGKKNTARLRNGAVRLPCEGASHE